MITVILYYCFLLLFMMSLCIGDILSYFLLEYHASHLLLAFLIVYYWYNASRAMMVYGTFLLCIESFIIHESCALNLVIALPVFMLIKAIKYRLYITPLQPMIMFSIALLLDIYLIQGMYKGLTTPPLYTISILFGNLIVILLLSLKLSGGKTRQSLMPFA